MKVIKHSDDVYRIYDDVSTSGGRPIIKLFEGSLTLVKLYLICELEISSEELSFALDTMERLGHDTAHFGVNCTFTHSSNSISAVHILAELRAIRDLRQEFSDCAAEFGDASETREAHARLISLYSALNVDAVIKMLDPDDGRIAA